MQQDEVGQVTSEERNLGMLCHLLSFTGYFFPLGHVLGPLILWLIKKDVSPFVDDHGKECLNFQISMTIWQILAIPLWLLLVGIPITAALLIVSITCTIIAAVKANAGEYYRYPICIRFIS
jgi:uncharacterized Tic20 family protein